MAERLVQVSLRDSAAPESKLSYYGWLVVGMAFLANFLGYGLMYTYGVFLKPMALEFDLSRSVVAGAFSVFGFVHNVLAFFAGRLVDRFGPRLIMAIAGFCIGLAMILMSYVTSVWQLYLFYGLIFSLGMAAMYGPSMATVSRWFTVKRGLAAGLAVASLGAGSLVFPPLSSWLVSSYSWREAYIVLGAISWATFIPIVRFIKQVPSEVTQTADSVSASGLAFSVAFRTRVFWAIAFTWMFSATALWPIMVHIAPLATDRGMPLVVGGILLGLIGVGSLVIRIVAGFLSDRLGRKRILVASLTLQAVMLIGLLFLKELWALYVFAIFFGMSSGGWTGVIVAFPADYFGLRATGAILGFILGVVGIGVAIGPLLGGYIFDTTQSYDYMLVMSAIATVTAIILTTLIKPLVAERKA